MKKKHIETFGQFSQATQSNAQEWEQLSLFRWAGIPDPYEEQNTATSEDSELGFALRNGL